MSTYEYESNPILDKLPKHLRQYIKPQNYEDYTPINQAVWRYVMRKNVDYLSKVAHKSYSEGLRKTGISIDNIPNMYGMNRILKDLGWAAVAVDGFIPPAAFMEFQAYNVLVIASDIRQLENITYTPAPDIIHEGAGHAPIIANPEYAAYLRRFGEIGCKAISSAKDFELYEAVRHLSIIKEAKGTPLEEIEKAEKHIEFLQENMGEPSEMALIRNLHWWTVEYGLIGTLDEPKIYGAGLLSSIGESQWCMTDNVKKLPYSIEAAKTSFDITKKQPQLFVTPDFAFLSQVLEDFANTMALRTGGLSGLQKLIDSQELGTIELSTGLQVSGNFESLISHDGKPIYFQTKGKSALAYREKELVGQDINQHETGFGSPNLQGRIILITFENCKVTHKGTILFESNNELYNMAIGEEIVSAYHGPADLKSFDLLDHSLSTNITNEGQEDLSELESYYKMIRDFREGKNTIISRTKVFQEIQEKYPTDWLLPIEIYELAVKSNEHKLIKSIEEHLENIKLDQPNLGQLIDDGLDLATVKLLV